MFLTALHLISGRGIGVPVNKAIAQDIIDNVSEDAIDYALHNWFVPKSGRYVGNISKWKIISFILSRWARLESNDVGKDDISDILPPILRGKKSNNFFPFPEGYYQSKVLSRNARSTQQSMEKSSALNIPWEMRYFSPMLRG